MLRRIIEIDEEKCNGCGLCAKACHEGAIGMVNGKAKLMHEHYCDGLGDCLPACPTGAIRFVEREAPAYDEAAVQAAKAAKGQAHTGGCPGSRMRTMQEKPEAPAAAGDVPSQLRQWPVQIKLVSPAAPYFDGADLLIAADCTAYAYGNFHSEFMRGKVTLIGCPKLDAAKRYTKVVAEGADSEVQITEKLLTDGEQHAISEMDVILNGAGSRTRVISRSVAKGSSTQLFYPRVQGNGPCFGHVSCDAIIMSAAKVRAIPEISCNHVDASLIHEAAIGRIAGEQLLKLETLGLTPEEAEEKILEGFLR